MNITLCKVFDYVPVASLRFYEKNPRTIERERLDQLKASIKNNGFFEPILVWRSKSKKNHNIVVSGNHRLIATRELIEEGFTFYNGGDANVLPVAYLSGDDEKIMSILMNSNQSFAKWIEEKVKAILDKCSAQEIYNRGFTREQADIFLKKSIEDADKVTEELKEEVEKVELKNLAPIPEDPTGIVVLNRDVFDSFNQMIAPLAKRLNKNWRVGDNLSEAVFSLVEKIESTKLVKKIISELEEKVDLDSTIEDESFEELTL